MGNGQGKRVVVIGAGIVGASLAYHLAGKGANVTLIEAGDIASGVTGGSFAWLNTSHPEPDPIAQLRGSAIKEYRRLETLQMPLFDRVRGRLRPTAQGLQLFEEVQRSYYGIERIVDAAKHIRQFQQAQLSVACLPGADCPYGKQEIGRAHV